LHLATFWLWARGNQRLAYGAVGAALLTRPDAGLLWVALAATDLVQNRLWVAGMRKQSWRILLPGLIYLPYATYALTSFGSILPSTMIAKSLAFSHPDTLAGRTPVGTSLLWLLPPPLPLLAALGVCIALNRAARQIQLPFLWLAIYVVAFILILNGELFRWYMAPAHTAVSALAGIGAAAGAQALLGTRNRPLADVQSIGGRALTGAVIVFLAVGVVRWTLSYRHESVRFAAESAMNGELGRYVAASSHPQATLFVGAFGQIGFYSQRFLHDRDGLVTPGMWDFYRNHEDREYASIAAYGGTPFIRGVQAFQPTYIAAVSAHRPGFQELEETLARLGYREEKRFDQPAVGVTRLGTYFTPNEEDRFFFALFRRDGSVGRLAGAADRKGSRATSRA
jgi:hypothetical protein